MLRHAVDLMLLAASTASNICMSLEEFYKVLLLSEMHCVYVAIPMPRPRCGSNQLTHHFGERKYPGVVRTGFILDHPDDSRNVQRTAHMPEGREKLCRGSFNKTDTEVGCVFRGKEKEIHILESQFMSTYSSNCQGSQCCAARYRLTSVPYFDL